MNFLEKSKFVLLPGDFVNLGDAMLALAAARHIAKNNGQCVLLPYRQPNNAICQEFLKNGFEVIGIRDRPLSALRACVGSSVRIGGGHAIRNDVSFGWLLFALLIAVLTRVSGHSFGVIGSGASPIKNQQKKKIFAMIFRLCQNIYTRDKFSADVLRSDFPVAIQKIKVAGDLAFLKNCIDLKSHHRENGTCLISPGIDIIEGRNENIMEIINVLEKLFNQKELKHVIVVSHDSRSEFGLPFCTNLKSLIEKRMAVPVDLVNSEEIEIGLLIPYGRARWIITGRLHGLIIGALQASQVFYTTGSAQKLRPFAEMFNFKLAEHEGLSKEISCPSSIDGHSLVLQQKAAELNFEN
ncbi:polysaccharide pyruvyl transferase family protein [Variovorax sp. RHLX14]|uniref:polysaccharide pyruvyl transferase family protein n=1 Tax=Variovorax sp. RHLX14 TaxID=1259731 RepID=UPI003F464E8F